nr:putative transcriptional regulatory protein [Quercus suber]
MRQAVGCGLHRASNGSSLIDQRRKRIFWTIYMLERSVAVTLGRPFCVSDRDIDVDLPANITDDIDDEQRILKAIEEASIESSKIHAISPALHIFRLHRIISKIQSTVHRVDRSISSANAIKIVQLRAALEDWKNGIQHSVSLIDENDAPNPYVTQSYHVLQYHKAMLFLLLPTLTWLPTSHPDFRVCAASAGLIGQLYRNLHNTQKVRISLSLLALHANLVAGLTLVYCFVADPTIFDAKFSGDIRACSTVLYIIAERWPAARKARDCLERFVQASVERCDETRNIDAGDSASTFNFQREHQDAVCRTTTEHVSAQAAQLGIGDLPQSDDIWDIFGGVLNNGEGSWFGDVGAQDLLQFG